MEDLTKDDLNNLGDWEKPEGNSYPYLKIGYFRLLDRTGDIENSFCITTSKYDFGNGVITEFKATTKEYLSKMCFFCEGKDLDFETKKSYSWDSICYDTHYRERMFKIFKTITGSNMIEPLASHLIATLKLFDIIAFINKQFPKTGSHTFFPVVLENGTIHYESKMNGEKLNNLGCESGAGFDVLLKTNLPLLRQYFGIKNEEA